MTNLEPVHVHIVSTDVPAASPPIPAALLPKRYATECNTLILNVGNGMNQTAVFELVADDLMRDEFYLQPLDFDVIICHTYAQAQSVGNVPAVSQTFPGGAYIPKTNTQWTGPIKGTDQMFIVSVGNAVPFPNRVSLLITRCAPNQ